MSEQSATSAADHDVVTLVLQQHEIVCDLCDAVTAAEPTGRARVLPPLIQLSAVHEAVEGEIVHPYVRRRARLREKNEVKKMLVALDVLGPSSAGFMPLLELFRTSVLAHAAKEASSEFVGVREQTRPAERTAMSAAVKVASALAPVHPHPGMEAAARTLSVGTPLAMVDRARNLIRPAMGPYSGADPAGAGSDARDNPVES